MRPSTTLACPQCGTTLVSGARFCLACGLAVGAPTVAGAATSAPVAGGFGSTSSGVGLTDGDRQSQLTQFLVEATLGEFEILGELGRGGMATVFLAHDLALDRKIAIKVIAPSLLSSEGAVERFKREARTAGALSHPHIIPIHSVRETQQLLYFVMKFVEGRTLDDIIREQRRLPIRMVQAILIEVGQALAYAHRRSVIHRDIKPANVMLDSEGWAVVTDFGIAKVLESDSLTASGAMVGTPFYMSPEQCAGKLVTGASDQYSLGVVAYEMLTGHPPFAGETIMEIMKGHFFEVPQPLEVARPDCPAPLVEAVTRMLAKEPTERWPSMDDAVGAMQAAPLAQDDPVRSEMMALARSSEALRRISRLSIPISPMPAGWTRARPLTSSNPAAPPPTLESGEEESIGEAPGTLGTMLKIGGALALLAALGGGAAWYARRQTPEPALPIAEAPAPAALDTVAPVEMAPAADSVAVAPPPVSGEAAPHPSGPSAAEVAQLRLHDAVKYLEPIERRLLRKWEQRAGADGQTPEDARVDVRFVISSEGYVGDLQAADEASELALPALTLLSKLEDLGPLPLSQPSSGLTVSATFTKTRVTLRPR